MSDHDESDKEIRDEVQIHNITRMISTMERDYLIRNNGEQINIDSLKGKKIGLYFSAWSILSKLFTPTLVEVYDELKSKGKEDFEFIFVSSDEDEESFESYFSEMPWLAIPFSDFQTRESLDSDFEVEEMPYLVLLDASGTVVTDKGVEFILEYGVNAYPFNVETVTAFKKDEEEAKRNQSLTSLLVSKSSDFVVSSDGKKIPVSSLQGKTVGLYFSYSSNKRCARFTEDLVKVYKEIVKDYESAFEVVMMPLDDDDDDDEEFNSVPWLSLPFNDKRIGKLSAYFDLRTFPTLVIIAPDGKTLQPDVVDFVGEHGSIAYPFTSEKLVQLEKAKREAQTLESVLVSDGLDFVIGKEGVKVPVSDLVGKNILIYFTAHCSLPCRTLLPNLLKVYNKIKEKESQFELISVSCDGDQASFDDYYATVPWLALPFGDKRNERLLKLFKVEGIPKLVAIGKNGWTVSTEVRKLVLSHGAEAYPFERTEEMVKEELAEGLAERVKVGSHEHELVLTKRSGFLCDECDEYASEGQVWSYYCDECDYDLHLKCALQDEKSVADEEKAGNIEEDAAGTKEGSTTRKRPFVNIS